MTTTQARRASRFSTFFSTTLFSTAFLENPLTTIGTSALLLAVTACGGGGGGPTSDGKSGGGGDLNKGSYDKGSFDYEDPYAAQFHPLQSKNFRVSRRDEIAIGAASNTASAHAAAHDDEDAKYGPLSLFGNSLFEKGFVPRVSKSGTLNTTRGDDLAYLGTRGTQLELVTLEADEQGAWKTSGKFTIQGSTLGFLRLELELIDIDDDGVDEFVVAATFSKSRGGFVRIFDDAAHGNRLLKNLDVAGSYRLQAKEFDANGDGQPEILILNRQVNSAEIAVLERADSDFAFQRDWTAVDRYSERLVVGNFDDDAGTEFGVVTMRYVSSRYRSYAIVYDYTEKGTPVLESAQILLDVRAIDDAVAVDTNRDRKHEIAAIGRYYSSSRWNARIAHWATKVDAGPRKNRLQTLNWTSHAQATRLAVHDGNADGREDIATVTLRSIKGSKSILSYVLTPNVDSKGNFTLHYNKYLGSVSLPSTTLYPTLATGDFDRENLVLRSTGKKWLDLPDPMPIVVMAAPPTKSEIRQNYDASATQYGTEQSTERSHGVTTGWTASFSTGFEAEDIFGVFGASAKQTLAWSMQKSLTNSRKVTWTKTFGGSYDKDVIIFQGTLYQVYEYEIVSAEDKKLVGSKITLNDPVATKTYKWTVDFYNQSVNEKSRIPQAVLSHTIGSPNTYMRKDVAQAQLKATMGWIDEGFEVGAVRGGSNGTSVSISDSNSTETSRSFSVNYEAEVKIGGATIGGSFGLDTESVYGVTVETGTTYQGEVGDIENTDDWQDWRYSFGILVYRYGADASGKPLKGMRPYHVVNYWVDDLGPAHR